MEKSISNKRKTDKLPGEESDEEMEEEDKGKSKKKYPKIKEKIKGSKSRSKSKSKNKDESKSKSRSKSKDKKDKKEKPKTAQLTLESFGIKSNIEDPSTKEYPNFPEDKNKLIKIVHWNVNGIRPLLRKRELDDLMKEEDPDIICFNETKIDNELIEKLNLRNIYNKTYKSFWYCPEEKKGYSGTAILTKYEPISVQYGINIDKHDMEGRVITIEFDKFYLISCYTPNSGEGLKRLDYRINEWDKDFFEYINSLKEKKDIILAGDLNVAKEDIDIYEPKGHEKTAGFTKEEKESFNSFLEMGYVDSYRDLHPEEQKFSFFSKRGNLKEQNKGWRLDYFIINEDSKSIKVEESDMLDKDKYDSSDHIPIFLTFKCK